MIESGKQQCCRCGWPFHPSMNGYLSGGTIDDTGAPWCTFCIKFAGGLRMERNLETVTEKASDPKPDLDMDLFRQDVVDGSESLRGKLQEAVE